MTTDNNNVGVKTCNRTVILDYIVCKQDVNCLSEIRQSDKVQQGGTCVTNDVVKCSNLVKPDTKPHDEQIGLIKGHIETKLTVGHVNNSLNPDNDKPLESGKILDVLKFLW